MDLNERDKLKEIIKELIEACESAVPELEILEIRTSRGSEELEKCQRIIIKAKESIK